MKYVIFYFAIVIVLLFTESCVMFKNQECYQKQRDCQGFCGGDDFTQKRCYNVCYDALVNCLDTVGKK